VLFGAQLERLATSGFVDRAAGRTLMADDIRPQVRTAREMLSALVAPGGVVAIWTEPVSSFVVNLLAALAAGLVVVPLDAHQSERELSRRLALVGAQAILADGREHGHLGWAIEESVPVLPGHVGELPAIATPPWCCSHQDRPGRRKRP
jgi:acyl-CoA synthetase (AMP-forming)/AMP-acid ligase II